MDMKVFGERNTGTNYLEQLIDKNTDVNIISGVVPKKLNKILQFVDNSIAYDVFTEKIRDIYFDLTFHKNFGWKHCAIDTDRIKKHSADDVIFICIIKNPYSWTLSMFKKPYHCLEPSNNYDTFLRKKWTTVGRENSSNQYKNIIKMWNYKVMSYYSLANFFDIKLVTYESLLNGHDDLFDFLKNKNVQVSGSSVSNINSSTKESDKNFSYYKKYYLDELWRNEISDENVAFINTNLDFELMEKIGYEIL